jgi:hypothetical protein
MKAERMATSTSLPADQLAYVTDELSVLVHGTGQTALNAERGPVEALTHGVDLVSVRLDFYEVRIVRRVDPYEKLSPLFHGLPGARVGKAVPLAVIAVYEVAFDNGGC